MMSSRRTVILFVVLAVTFGVLASCSSGAKGADGQVSGSTTTTTVAPTPAASSQCDPPATASYLPVAARPAPGAMPAGSKMAEIAANGTLKVGVSADNLGFGFRNPVTNQIEGFDIDMAHAVAKAIFGNPDAIKFVVMPLGQRQPSLVANDVDMVADVFTMTCGRWNDPGDPNKSIAFSSQYFSADKRILVAKDSGIKGIDDLKDRKVCFPSPSTTADRIAEHPDVIAVPVAQNSDCMVLFQSGQVDAVAGDVPILNGFAKQDPYAEIVGVSLSNEPYGLGVNKDNVDFVRFINSVLAEMRADGEWAVIYEHWLGSPVPTPPKPDYGRG